MKHKTFRLKSDCGFILIEVLISVLILAIVIAGGMAFYFYLEEMQSMATHKKIATEQAHSMMEDLKQKFDKMEYSTIQNSATADACYFSDVCDKSVVSADAKYNACAFQFGGLQAWSTYCIKDSNPADGTYKILKVNVNWKEVKNKTDGGVKNFQLLTYITP